eukprot:SAG22_NODE_178_length_16142_cov_13.187995_19_plen_263_part_00
MHALLEELEVSNNTLTIYSADNGGSIHWGILGGTNGNLRCGKGTLYEGGVRVPAIVRWPGVVAPGGTVRALTSSLDWMPTFASLAGYKLDVITYDGWDMSQLLFTQAGQRADLGRRDRYFYHTSASSGANSAALVAVRLGPWKLWWETAGWACEDDYPDEACCSNKPAGHSIDQRAAGGVLYNVERDTSEVLPIPHGSAEYKKWAPVLWSMAADYLANDFSTQASEMAKGSSKDRFPCGSPGCTPLPDCCTVGSASLNEKEA